MGKDTGIGWTHDTFNPFWGCTQVSPACGLPLRGEEGWPHGKCYAMVLDGRFPILGQTHWGKDAPRRFFGDDHWRQPVRWNRTAKKAGERRRVFCGSMCDIMEDRRDLDESRDRLYDLVLKTPSLDWLFLTKRPQNYRRFLPEAWLDNPPDNLWLGTTVETPEYYWRINELAKLKAVVRFLSLEPMLKQLLGIGAYLDVIDWVILGGESGPGARQMPLEWLEHTLDIAGRCGVAAFMKQMGSNLSDQDLDRCVRESGRSMHHKAGADPNEWPARFQVQQFPTPRRLHL